MTELKGGTSEQIRELSGDEMQAAAGGSASSSAATTRWVNPLDLYGFNPQPDPPAMPVGQLLGH